MFIPVDIDKSLYFPLRPFGLSIHTGTICERFSNNNGKWRIEQLQHSYLVKYERRLIQKYFKQLRL